MRVIQSKFTKNKPHLFFQTGGRAGPGSAFGNTRVIEWLLVYQPWVTYIHVLTCTQCFKSFHVTSIIPFFFIKSEVFWNLDVICYFAFQYVIEKMFFEKYSLELLLKSFVTFQKLMSRIWKFAKNYILLFKKNTKEYNSTCIYNVASPNNSWYK